MKDDAYFDAASGSVRFWVEAEGSYLGASISSAVLRYRYRGGDPNPDPLQIYLDHMLEIDEAVRKRSAAGSREPIMVREPDFG